LGVVLGHPDCDLQVRPRAGEVLPRGLQVADESSIVEPADGDDGRHKDSDKDSWVQEDAEQDVHSPPPCRPPRPLVTRSVRTSRKPGTPLLVRWSPSPTA